MKFLRPRRLRFAAQFLAALENSEKVKKNGKGEISLMIQSSDHS